MPKPYTPNDPWAKKAREEGYRARSVYKLMELDLRFSLLRPGMAVLDLGAAPGSWLQYAKERVGPRGSVTGIDLQAIEPLDGVLTIRADIADTENIARILSTHLPTAPTLPSVLTLPTLPTVLTLPTLPTNPVLFDLILSDLAPSTSGMRGVDQWKSIELNRAALAIAREFLKPGGRIVLKVLRGEDFADFLKEVRREWRDVKPAHVAASRDRSKEIYVIVSGRLQARRGRSTLQ